VTADDSVLLARRADDDGLRRVIRWLKEVPPGVERGPFESPAPARGHKSLGMGERCRVKRIVVKKGGRLLLQLHHHRAEHWGVIRGPAR
jgi:mannose-6-phosphate isomerase-like protein (cupin superfamily)